MGDLTETVRLAHTLIGQPVEVTIDWADPPVTVRGVLVKFDNYGEVILLVDGERRSSWPMLDIKAL